MFMKSQQGSVIVVTLWTIILMTILITVIAGQIRLSSQAAFFHQEEVVEWASVMTAMNNAEMELLMERMPRPAETIENLEELDDNPAYRFDGEALELEYPQDETIAVRIYDHAGKINLREISRPRMRALLEKKLGEDADDQIDDLIAAWGDWIDLNDSAGINGAERNYYLDLDQPYSPRDAKLETVDEILLIRGFDEVFADVDLEAAFTLYTDDELINLNVATVEAMQLLPGLDDELIEEIIAWRQVNEFRGNGDVAQIVPAEDMAELRPWLNARRTSGFYTIFAYKQQIELQELFAGQPPMDVDVTNNGYSVTLQVTNFNQKPKVLRVNPYQRIPTRIVVDPEHEYLQ